MFPLRKNFLRSGNRFPLPVYISILLIAVALLTLLAAVGSIEIFLRPALINQISSDTQKEAQTQVKLIDTYFSERLNDVKILSQSQSLKDLLNDQNTTTKAAASSLLFSTFHRDVADYISISVLDMHDNVVVTYPVSPQRHGQFLIQPEAETQLQTTSATVIASDVFYDPLANNPSIDLYVRIFNDNFQPLGTVRTSISLHRLWEPVDSESQENGTGSYAFVLDQHGIRIAYTNPDHSGFTQPKYLFKSIAELPLKFQEQIKNENLYGNDANPVTNIDDSSLSTATGASSQASSIFQLNPTGQSQTFVAAKYTSTVFSWTYFVLKPLSTVTGLADQQLQTVILIVSIVILLAMVIGVQSGRRITLPIMRSILSLHNNSLTLKTLADQEQTVATEQTWMVEASQIAIKSVRYYTLASRRAAHRLAFLCTDMRENPQHFDKARFENTLSELSQIAAYIESALQYQEEANERLSSSIRVTTQAATQLTSDAKSTDEMAVQLEQIVQQLMTVVGNNNESLNEKPEAAEEAKSQ